MVSERSINDVDVKAVFGRDIYKERGYKTRYKYLEHLADLYEVDLECVLDVADMLGPTEDFDGLIAMLDDYGFMIAK